VFDERTKASTTFAHRPFPHLVMDGWWDDELLRDVASEFPPVEATGWRRYVGMKERKLEGPPGLWGRHTRELFNEIEHRAGALEQIFGIPDLQMETIGGGYHCIEPGGFLAVHTDFNRSPNTGHHRRLNLLVYLNEDWTDPGGNLELWDTESCAVEIAPEFNRTAVFETSDRSWHGHPKPAQRWRRSVAAYFFTEAPPAGAPMADQSTVWHTDA
jgi:hypothetical protein